MANKFVRIGRFVLDVTLSEDHTFEADVTDYPVESGGSVSDNIRPRPMKITIEGVISDTPLTSNTTNRPAAFTEPKGYTVDAVSGGTNAETSGEFEVKFLPSEEAFAYLQQIWESRDTVTVQTSLGTWENMAMESFSVPRSKETTGGLKFTAQFKQIQKVTNERIKSSVRNGNGKRNRGPQTGKAAWWIREVTWRKGAPPGSANIYATEQVRLYWKPVLMNDRMPAQWYHWSGEKGVPTPQPLTQDEFRAFLLDNKRDERDRRVLGAAAFGRGGTSGNADLAKIYGTEVPSHIYVPKMFTKDMSQTARDLGSSGTSTAVSGSPKFNNEGNYLTGKSLKPEDYSTSNALRRSFKNVPGINKL